VRRLWKPAHVSPVLYVLIDLDHAWVETVHPIAAWARHPEVPATVDIEVVGLEALPLERLEHPPTVSKVRPVFEKVARPIRAGPARPSLISMNMMRESMVLPAQPSDDDTTEAPIVRLPAQPIAAPARRNRPRSGHPPRTRRAATNSASMRAGNPSSILSSRCP